MSASDHHLYHLLQLAAHRLKKAADRAIVADAGLTTAQAAVLVIVATEGPMSQRAVADRLDFVESAITAMVGRLLVLDLIERRRSETDARAWTLEITQKGRAALEATRAPMAAINETLDGALSTEEMDAFADYLKRVAGALKDA